MECPTDLANEYDAIFLQPQVAIDLLTLCAQQLRLARHLLTGEDLSIAVQQMLLQVAVAEYHLREALALIPPRMAPLQEAEP